jgi:hypothetical protein
MVSTIVRLGLMAVLLFAGALVQAQTWTPAQQEVWKVSADTWEQDLNKDHSWTERSVSAQVSAWGSDYPAPRGKSSMGRWHKHWVTQNPMVMYDLAPLAVAVSGDAAVTHYYYTLATTDAGGKQSVTHGRCSDTLVRENGRWVFLGWSCSDEPKRD